MKLLQSCCLLLATFLGTSLWAQTLLPLYLDDSKPLDQRVEHALSLLTLEEKVALTHAQSLFSIRGVPRLGIPELRMTDGPHGIRGEVGWSEYKDPMWTSDSCTAFPNLTCLAATWNPDLAAQYGRAIGEEARYREKHVLLGPGVNIIRTPLNGRNFEYLSEDPHLTSVMAVPYIRGVQANGVAACVKHFALNNQEVWRHFINVEVSDRALHEIYLPAFKASVQEGGALAVMAAYNKYQGQWAAQNPGLLKKILKEDWQFRGAVISDWNAVHHTLDAAAGGLDIEMGTKPGKGKTFDDYFFARPYLAALRSGKAGEQELDDKARRALRLIFTTAMNRHRPFGSFATEEHAAVGRRISAEGIVLLKNSPALLPLNVQAVRTIAVIGENATRSMTQGGGSSTLKVFREVSPLQGLKSRLGREVEIRYAQGYSHKGESDSLFSGALEAARGADMVLFIGGLSKDKGQDAESADRRGYGLPFGQDRLIEALLEVNKNMVVVLVAGTAVEMPWANRVPAIVQAWYGGTEAGTALADVLSGDVNPSGKLPFTINRRLGDYGAHAVGGYPGDSVDVQYREGVLVGYRWNDTKKIRPLYSFGHGLSYTTFSYGKAAGDKKVVAPGDSLTVSLKVKNTGSRDGKEVVQLYIRDVAASVERPFKELKAFQKVALRPGEEQVVSFVIHTGDLQFYDEAKGAWTAEAGQFQALVGTSSADIRAQVGFELKVAGKEWAGASRPLPAGAQEAEHRQLP